MVLKQVKSNQPYTVSLPVYTKSQQILISNITVFSLTPNIRNYRIIAFDATSPACLTKPLKLLPFFVRHVAQICQSISHFHWRGRRFDTYCSVGTNPAEIISLKQEKGCINLNRTTLAGFNPGSQTFPRRGSSCRPPKDRYPQFGNQ